MITTNKGLEEQTVIDVEDFINKTEEALTRLLIKWQKLELLKSLKIPGFKITKKNPQNYGRTWMMYE